MSYDPAKDSRLVKAKRSERGDELRTPNPKCDACRSSRWHTPEDWKNHPKAGTGKELAITRS